MSERRRDRSEDERGDRDQPIHISIPSTSSSQSLVSLTLSAASSLTSAEGGSIANGQRGAAINGTPTTPNSSAERRSRRDNFVTSPVRSERSPSIEIVGEVRDGVAITPVAPAASSRAPAGASSSSSARKTPGGSGSSPRTPAGASSSRVDAGATPSSTRTTPGGLLSPSKASPRGSASSRREAQGGSASPSRTRAGVSSSPRAAARGSQSSSRAAAETQTAPLRLQRQLQIDCNASLVQPLSERRRGERRSRSISAELNESMRRVTPPPDEPSTSRSAARYVRNELLIDMNESQTQPTTSRGQRAERVQRVVSYHEESSPPDKERDQRERKRKRAANKNVDGIPGKRRRRRPWSGSDDDDDDDVIEENGDEETEEETQQMVDDASSRPEYAMIMKRKTELEKELEEYHEDGEERDEVQWKRKKDDQKKVKKAGILKQLRKEGMNNFDLWRKRNDQNPTDVFRVDYVVSCVKRKIGDAVPGNVLIKYENFPIPSWYEWSQKDKNELLAKKFERRLLECDLIELSIRHHRGDVEFERLFPERYLQQHMEVDEYIVDRPAQYRTELMAIEYEWNESNRAAGLPELIIEDWLGVHTDIEKLEQLKFVNYLYRSAEVKKIVDMASQSDLSLTRCSSSCVDCSMPLQPLTGIGCSCNGQKDSLEMAVIECSDECGCDEKCGNRVVQKGRTVRLCVFREPVIGWGLRTLEELDKEQFVTEYSGKVEAKKSQGTDCYYDYDMVKEKGKKQLTIAAGKKGNESRFLNHSCYPNIFSQNRYVERFGRFYNRQAFFTYEPIKAGQQLNLDYFSGLNRPNASYEHYLFDKCSCAYPEVCDFPRDDMSPEENAERMARKSKKKK